MKKFLKLVFAVFMFLIFVNSTTANFNVGNYSIQKSYGPGQAISGWVNISFTNEPTNSIFEDSFGNLISLIDLLRNSTNYVYECNIAECQIDYSVSNGQTNKNFYLNNDQKKVLGFKLTGEVDSITSIKFNITSNAGASCTNQLEMDILNDGIIDFINNKSSIGVCQKSYGCSNDSKELEIYSLDFTPYCQKIELGRAPGFKIGALIKKDSGAGSLKMSLYKDNENIEVGNCNLADPSNSDWQEISCNINYPILEKEEYYVCIFSENGAGNYKIKGYSDSNGCGFHGFPTKQKVASYKIFAQAKNFDAIGNLAVNNEFADGETLSAKAQEYISTTYGNGIDCSNGCVIPITFKSGYNGNQNIELKNLEIKYVKTSGIVTETNFYDLQEIPAKVSSDYGKLFLDMGGFYVPEEYGNNTFELKLNNAAVLAEEISIETVPLINSLSPLKTPAGIPTNFKINAEAVEGNLTKFEWNFGNGDLKQSSINSIIYSYNATGTYELKIKITDNKQKTSEKKFNIFVESPKNYINTTLKEKQKELENIKNKIRNFSTSEQKSINKILNVDELDSNLTNLERRYATKIYTENEYITFAKELINLNIPKDVWESKGIDSSIFYSDTKNIDLSLIKEIGKGTYEETQSESYKSAVLAWNQKNLNAKISFKEFSVRFLEDKQLVNLFSFTISKKDNSDKEVFFVVPKIENLKFEESYNEREKDNYFYITINNFPKMISFSTTEDVDFIDVGIFISPSLSELSLDNNENTEEPQGFNWTIFITIIFVLILFGIILYFLIYKWYKSNYENYLFKNKNNLYNLLAYIDKSKKSGMGNSEINKNLKKAGWDSEQTEYAIKKYEGKRTGMFNLHFIKIFDGIKKDNKQQNEYNSQFGPQKTFRRRF